MSPPHSSDDWTEVTRRRPQSSCDGASDAGKAAILRATAREPCHHTETELAKRPTTWAETASAQSELQTELDASEAKHAATAAELSAMAAELAALHSAQKAALDAARLAAEGKARRLELFAFLNMIYSIVFALCGRVFGSAIRNNAFDEKYFPGEDLRGPPPSDWPQGKIKSDIDVFLPRGSQTSFVQFLKILLKSHKGYLRPLAKKSSSVVEHRDGTPCACNSYEIRIPNMPSIPIDVVYGDIQHFDFSQDVVLINMIYRTGMGVFIRTPLGSHGESLLTSKDALFLIAEEEFHNRKTMILPPQKYCLRLGNDDFTLVFKGGFLAKRLARFGNVISSGFVPYVRDDVPYKSCFATPWSSLRESLTTEQMDQINAPDAVDPDRNAQCSICQEDLDDIKGSDDTGGVPTVVYLRCSHLHCFDCFKTLVDRAIDAHGTDCIVTCSVCRGDVV